MQIKFYKVMIVLTLIYIEFRLMDNKKRKITYSVNRDEMYVGLLYLMKLEAKQ